MATETGARQKAGTTLSVPSSLPDGAVWIGRLADDRFPGVRQRPDFPHAVQHLAAVGRAVCGEDPNKARLAPAKEIAPAHPPAVA